MASSFSNEIHEREQACLRRKARLLQMKVSSDLEPVEKVSAHAVESLLPPHACQDSFVELRENDMIIVKPKGKFGVSEKEMTEIASPRWYAMAIDHLNPIDEEDFGAELATIRETLKEIEALLGKPNKLRSLNSTRNLSSRERLTRGERPALAPNEGKRRSELMYENLPEVSFFRHESWKREEEEIGRAHV